MSTYFFSHYRNPFSQHTGGALRLSLLLILILFIFPLFFTSTAYALFTEASRPLELSISPQFPAPGSVATVGVTTLGEDIRGATIAWYVDGKEASSSRNAHTINVPTPASGSALKIEARVKTAGGKSYILTRSLTLAGVDIIAEPNTYVPPRYVGKALPAAGNSVRLVAVPHLYERGVLVPKKDILFTWMLNGATLYGGAQLGTDIITITMPRYGRADITVLAEKNGTGIGARSNTTLIPTKPHITFYETSSLYGTTFHSPSTFTSDKEQLSIVAVPYYVDKGIAESEAIEYTWQVDGSKVPPGDDPRTVVLTPNARPVQHVDLTFSSLSNLLLGNARFSAQFTQKNPLTP